MMWKPGHRRGRQRDAEEAWGGRAPSAVPRQRVAWPKVLVVLALLVAVAVGVHLAGWLGGGGSRVAPAAVVDDREAAQSKAEAVARAFLSETDPQARLQWARDRDRTARHLEAYHPEARSFPGRVAAVLGSAGPEGQRVHGFQVVVQGGKPRLLEVVETPEGPKVDWDAYARHGSVPWEDLLEGRETAGEMRVFVSPGDFYNKPFRREEGWTSFLITSPELPHGVHAFARTGTAMKQRMRAAVMGTRSFRQHMILRLDRQEDMLGDPLFEIEELVEVGWVRWGGETDSASSSGEPAREE